MPTEDNDFYTGDFEADAASKWRIGRRRYGPKWVGSTALMELYAELLDAYNYTGRANREEDEISIDDCIRWQSIFKALGEEVLASILEAERALKGGY